MTRRPVFSLVVYAWMFALLAVHALCALVLLPWTWSFDRDRRATAGLASWMVRASARIPPYWRPAMRSVAAFPPRPPAVIVANHRSMADIAISVALPGAPRLCAKPWVARIPLMGLCMRLAGHVVLDPGSLVDVRDSMERIEGLVRRGVSVVFFPEGTRGRGAGLGRFEHGAFRVAVRTGVDVVPVVFHDTGELLPPGGIWFTDRAPGVTVLARIAPGDDRRALRQRVRDAILTALEARRSPAGDPHPRPGPAAG